MRCPSRAVHSACAIGLAALLGAATVATAQSAAMPLAPRADGPHPTYLGKTLYTGEFHAHTSVSDGSKLPVDAIEYVYNKSGIDFFTLAEHDVMWDIRNGDDFITDWRNATSAEWTWVHQQAFDFNARQDKLVAVPAIENTWYDGTGHINVFNTQWHATARATAKGSIDGFGSSFGTGDLKYDMFTFFARLKQDTAAIAQFNHPSTKSKGFFFGFKGLDRVTDDRMEMVEVHSVDQIVQFQNALDAGWHLAPVSNGDEHQPNWVTSNQALTGIWATEHTLKGLYAAMRARSMYSSRDSNVVLKFSANGAIMGAILPAGTRTLKFDIALSDGDATDSFTSVQLITNGGAVAHDFPNVRGNDVHLALTLAAKDGDFYYVRAGQADSQFVVSAPIWVGPTTRGANYAPTITILDKTPAHVIIGQRIALPKVNAKDDSGIAPTVKYEVWDGAGQLPVKDGAFTVRSYDDHFIVVKATDNTGNINAELIRLQVDPTVLTAATVFRYLGSVATVADRPNGAGLAVSTDRHIARVYAQVRKKGATGWATPVLASTNDRPWEINTIGNDEPEYQHSITGQTLRSHEVSLTGLEAGATYEYRFGVPVYRHARGSAGGAASVNAPSASDAAAWTPVQGEFMVPRAGNQPIYVVGSMAVTSHDAAQWGQLRNIVARLQQAAPGGATLLQTGDLVDNGGRAQYWDEAFAHALKGVTLQLAPVVGDRESAGDPDYNSITKERSIGFDNLFALPKNGALTETNYSFDRGDMHIAVLNTNGTSCSCGGGPVDNALLDQLAWLTADLAESSAKWKLVVGHRALMGDSLPVRPTADQLKQAADRRKVADALASLGVQLYLSGHDGVYTRSSQGKTTFVSVGAASPSAAPAGTTPPTGMAIEPTRDGLLIRVYTIDGRLIDSVTLR